MTPLLRDLLWSIALVLLGWFGFTILDENSKLASELAQTRKVIARDTALTQTVQWQQVRDELKLAQHQWLNLLAPVQSPGKFRAEALETLSDLCLNQEVQCKLSAQGEAVESLPASLSSTLSVSGRQTLSPSWVTASSRLSIALQPGHLQRILPAIERGNGLRSIEKLSIRGVLAEVDVKTYGLSASNWETSKRWASEPDSTSTQNQVAKGGKP